MKDDPRPAVIRGALDLAHLLKQVAHPSNASGFAPSERVNATAQAEDLEKYVKGLTLLDPADAVLGA